MKNTILILAASMYLFAACNNASENHDHADGDHTHDAKTERPSISNNDDALPPGAHKHGDNVVGVMGAGPNKGLIVHGNTGYHIEMVIDGANLAFYPMDQNANAVDGSGWTGNVVV